MALCCGGTGPDPSEVETLTIYVAGRDERVLGPLGSNPWFLVFLGLALPRDGSVDSEPRLADRWEHTPDYSEWTVHLREDVRWNDGTPVTARDVKSSLELWTREEVLYEYPFFDSITVIDPHTLHFTFAEPVSGTIFTYNWLAIVPEHLLGAMPVEELFEWPFWVQPVGDGPYRYVRHVPGTMTELEANPDYFADPPRIPRVRLRYGGNPVTEMLSGNVDVAGPLAPLEVLQLKADPRFDVYHVAEYQQSSAIAWNHRLQLFDQASLRRALTMAIDRRELHRVLNYPDDLRLFDVPTLGRHHDAGRVPEPLALDRERAGQLMADAGWIDTDGDGIREREGEEFRFTLSVSDATSAHAVFIQDQLRRVGVAVDIATYDRSVLLQRVLRTGDFDAVIFQYNFIEQFGSFPVTGYANPELGALRDSAWFSISPDESDMYLARFWTIFADQMPVTYLHPFGTFRAMHRRVRGFENGMDFFVNVERLWIEEGDAAGR